MLNNYLVRTRLIVLALFPVIIFTVTAIYLINTVGGLVKGIDDLYDNRIVPLKQIKTVSDNYAVNIVDLFHKYRAGTVSQTALLTAVQEAKNTADKEWRSYLSTDLTDQEKNLTAVVEQRLVPVQQHLQVL
ncbi:MCP four helix bundle domain-containing protein [Pseudoalteromonas haloplanktis]|uniref:MCP four helix bundle domain-containing protein n=1 Tax=Pseudoalteromonas haloplanktis TaxID=228 RepID=A0ABU1BB59_PSEHA|nr:MCP four helix bundle domain-containing protein [Pseudoalteromonas haloplanktis]MDQ9091601.1 MCP four helix bundle domain-containing protein [Pseudoalteromonas haloplanktis]